MIRNSRILRSLSPETTPDWHMSNETNRIDLDITTTSSTLSTTTSNTSNQHFPTYYELNLKIQHYLNRIFQFAILFLFLTIVMVGIGPDSTLDSCYLDRFANPKTSQSLIAINKVFLFPTCVTLTFLFLIYFFLNSFFNSRKSKQHIHSHSTVNNNNQQQQEHINQQPSLVVFPLSHWKEVLLNLLYICTWYYISFSLVVFLKISIGDTICNKHPNSVSGHYNFMIYSLLTVNLLSLLTGWRNRIFWICYIIYLSLAIILLADTFFDGYHSFRQCFYGSTVAIISHFIIAKLITLNYSKNGNSNSGEEKEKYENIIYYGICIYFGIVFLTRFIWEYILPIFNVTEGAAAHKGFKRSIFFVNLPCFLLIITILILKKTILKRE
ncbi:hypothetical protein ABK040_003304 [Willaertia magna]